MVDEGNDGGFKLQFEEVVFTQDAVLRGLMPPLYCAFSLRVHLRAPNRFHALVVKTFRQIASDVRRAIIAVQARFVHNLGAVAA